MSPRAKSAAAALLCLTLAIAAMAALGLSCALGLIARDLIDTADGVGAEISQQIRVSLLQAGADPLKSLRDDVELQRFLWTSRALRRNLVYAQIETADGHVILTAERGSANWVPKSASSIEDLRGQSRSPIPLALLPSLWSPHIFALRRPVLYDGQSLGMINVGVSSVFVADDVRALARILAWCGVVTLGLTWLAFCLLAGRLPQPATLEAGDRSRAGDGLVELLASLRDGALTIDRQGVVGFANSKARYLLGPQAAMAGKPIRNGLGSEHPMVQIVEAAIAGPAKAQHLHLDIYGSQSRLGTVTVSTFPVSHDNGLVVLLGEPAAIDEVQDGPWPSSSANGSQPNGAPRHAGLVEITLSQQGNLGIHPRYLRELLDLYFSTARNGEQSGSALVSRALELHRGIGQQQAGDDQVIARIRLPVGSAPPAASAMETVDKGALAPQ